MNRKDTINYLNRKGEIEIDKGKFLGEDEKVIEKVMKKGKIFGDPVVECQ